MSVWTHISGSIRIDGMQFPQTEDQTEHAKQLEIIIKECFGNTCGYEDTEENQEWENCNVPCGSESSIQYKYLHTGDESSLSRGTIIIWGDLRNYSNEKEIFEWIKDAMFLLYTKHLFNCRMANILIEIEYGKNYLIINDNNNNSEYMMIELPKKNILDNNKNNELII